MKRLSLAVASVLFVVPFASALQAGHSAHPDVAGGRAAFKRAWQAWSEAPEGPGKDALALEVDRLAGQRYATVSRLYWHRDLESALAAAGDSGKPILALRLLGNLDEDLSCANSRLFRVVLYADAGLSEYLREHFELLWTSERPVPRVTIDFGDGRVLERTITGNSAHFVLDRRGRPVDVLPGLYGPRLFRAALEPAEALARDVVALDGDEFSEALAQFHRARLAESDAFVAALGRPAQPPMEPTLMASQGLTLRKRAMEIGTAKALALGTFDVDATLDFTPRWESWQALAEGLPPETLDAASRALFAALQPTDWRTPGQPLDESSRDALLERFERDLRVESVANEHGLHAQVHRWFLDTRLQRDLPSLQFWVYASLFLTPAADPWLGLATPGVFSALPRDGLNIASTPSR